jgi:hypothetical protein
MTSKRGSNEARHKYKLRHDKDHTDPRFKVGDRVLLYTPPHGAGLSSKLIKKIWSEPLTVTEVKGPLTVQVTDPKTSKSQTVYVQRLRLWQDESKVTEAPPSRLITDDTPLTESDLPHPRDRDFVFVRRDRDAQRGFVARVLSWDPQAATVTVHAFNTHSRGPLEARKFLPAHYKVTKSGKTVESFTKKPATGFDPYIQLVDQRDIVSAPFQLDGQGHIPQAIITTLPDGFTL